MSDTAPRIAFIGGGNMTRSLIGGLLRARTSAPRIAVAELDAETRANLERDFAVSVHADGCDAAREANVVVLAIKPQVMQSVCTALADVVRVSRPLVISIAAGIRSDQIDTWLGGGIAIVRAMPNTPALIGAGASGLCANAHVDADARTLAQTLLGAVGLAVWIDDEALMDTVTALSGSGPAYFFLLAEALEAAAVAQGLPRDAARALTAETCLGAGRMLHEDGATAAILRQRVTSPNGTTQAALESFEADGLREIVTRAVAAATRRGGELSTQWDG